MTFVEQPLRQDWSVELPKYYFDNSPTKTHILNAFSITLPQGEKLFIDSIKNARHKVSSAARLHDIDVFIKQENWHTYAHQQYNQWLILQGLSADTLEEYVVRKRLDFLKEHLPPQVNLNVTVCLEHITSTIATLILENPELQDKMHPHFRQLWVWHSIEEIEHRSVAMDTLNTAFNLNINRKRACMILTTSAFIWDIFLITISLLKEDNQLWKWKTLKDGMDVILNIRKVFTPWLRFMKMNFHPNDVDHTTLLQKYNKI